MTKPVCVVIGVGPGNGAAIARKFASEGYAVALCARSVEKLALLEAELDAAKAYAYDATDKDAAEKVFADIKADFGAVSVVAYNAGSGTWGSVDNVSIGDFQNAWEVNTRGLLLATKAALPSPTRASSARTPRPSRFAGRITGSSAATG